MLPGSGAIYLTESAIDALSIKAHKPDAEVHAVGGDHMSLSALKLTPGKQIFLAFDNDANGDKLKKKARELYKDAIDAPPPAKAKDWNKALQNDQSLINDEWQDTDQGEQKTTHKISPSFRPSNNAEHCAKRRIKSPLLFFALIGRYVNNKRRCGQRACLQRPL